MPRTRSHRSESPSEPPTSPTHSNMNTRSNTRVTRSGANSVASSRQGSIEPPTLTLAAKAKAKPAIQNAISASYGSPDHPQAPKRLRPQLRNRAPEAVIEEALERSERAANRGREPSSTPFEEETETSVPTTMEKPAPISHWKKVNDNVDHSWVTEPPYKYKDPAHNVDEEDALQPLSTNLVTSDRYSTKRVLLGMSIFATIILLGALGAPAAITAVATGLAAQVQGLLSAVSQAPANLISSLASGHGAANITVPGVAAKEIARLKSQMETIQVRHAAQVETLQARHESELSAIQKRLTSLESIAFSRSRESDVTTPRGINIFAPSSGIIVDEYLTSPTRTVREKHPVLASLSRAFHGAPIVRPNDPYTALMPWDDHGDAWCAATSARGRSQLSLVLPQRVAPSTLVVEHIDHRATPDPGATPQEVELWIQVPDFETRALLAGRIRAEFGGKQELNAEESTRELPALDRNWIRVASGTYDPRSPQRSQAFEVPASLALANHGIFAKRVTVRVKSTWGPGDFACLYRVKMFGMSEYGESKFHG